LLVLLRENGIYGAKETSEDSRQHSPTGKGSIIGVCGSGLDDQILTETSRAGVAPAHVFVRPIMFVVTMRPPTTKA
jgi:hypothetical protein